MYLVHPLHTKTAQWTLSSVHSIIHSLVNLGFAFIHFLMTKLHMTTMQVQHAPKTAYNRSTTKCKNSRWHWCNHQLDTFRWIFHQEVIAMSGTPWPWEHENSSLLWLWAHKPPISTTILTAGRVHAKWNHKTSTGQHHLATGNPPEAHFIHFIYFEWWHSCHSLNIKWHQVSSTKIPF